MMSLFQIHYSWESLYVHKFIPNINADLVCEVSCHLKPIEQNGMGERKDGRVYEVSLGQHSILCHDLSE